MIPRLKRWAQQLKAEVVTLWFAYRHPQTPWYAKWLAVAVVAYAFSPIDLIPDFIPVLGFLDDALLLPIGIWLTIKFIPRSVLEECRGQATQWLAEQHDKPRNWTAAIVIVVMWVLIAWLCWRWFVSR